MKTCTRCKIEKDDAEFRVKVEKRHDPHFKYLNNHCKQCDAERAKIYHAKKKDDPEYKKKAVERARKNYWENRDRSVESSRKYRQRPESKANRKEYDKARALIISRQRKPVNKKYNDKLRNENLDEYAARLLRTQTGIPKEIIKQHPQILEAKKLSLQILHNIKNQL